MTAASRPKQLVLIVEDDEFLSRMYVSKFEFEGFNVISASDGDSGLLLAINEKPDIVLLDLALPKRDGFNVLAELKRRPETKGIPVIVLTNLSQKEQIDRCFSLGAKDVLIKAHFVPSEVVAKVRTVLGG